MHQKKVAGNVEWQSPVLFTKGKRAINKTSGFFGSRFYIAFTWVASEQDAVTVQSYKKVPRQVVKDGAS